MGNLEKRLRLKAFIIYSRETLINVVLSLIYCTTALNTWCLSFINILLFYHWYTTVLSLDVTNTNLKKSGKGYQMKKVANHHRFRSKDIRMCCERKGIDRYWLCYLDIWRRFWQVLQKGGSKNTPLKKQKKQKRNFLGSYDVWKLT